ncbi:MAG: HAD family hydrolase [Candidatus Thiothrix singaporensis]|uniref:HAD family hydrolase n=1 Tax=Candidatus Thiothrix singaporensis TaxID=2799669 RepID=A0A7L6AX14_9GAMM|nr:MAG: HAD family hydrolase [Candidatus Thiothrix singaporensis]
MKPVYLQGKQAVLLDMNSTFMFGEDRFDSTQDYSLVYRQLGGNLPAAQVNRLIRDVMDYLTPRYPAAEYQEAFPSIPAALKAMSNTPLSDAEMSTLAMTFAMHERGHIPPAYVQALHQLATHFRLGLVIDIWAAKDLWEQYFRETGIHHLFEAVSFSSDHGCVKPSPYGFRQILQAMRLQPEDALFIGDSVRRDLGGAQAAGLDCVLVGGAESAQAIAAYPDLLSLCCDWFG